MSFVPMTSFFYLILLALIALLLLYKLTYDFDYWKKRGVPFVKPLPLFGNFFDVLTFRVSIGHGLQSLYHQIEKPFFGIFVLNKPFLVLKDLKLISLILVKDFNFFPDRNILCSEKHDPIVSKMTFTMKNPEWKALRLKISPLFSAAKIKKMSNLINDVAQTLTEHIEKNLDGDGKNVVGVKELCAMYTTDVITSCAFGLQGNSFDCKNNHFRQAGRDIVAFSWTNGLRQISYFMAPLLVRIFKFGLLPGSAAIFLKGAFLQTIRDREGSEGKRNDLIDIMIQSRKVSNQLELDEDVMVAQAIQYFAAGYETTGTTMTFALHEIATNSGIQARLREEIRKTTLQHGGINYQAIQDMKYLNMVVNETLRKYPVFTFLDRQCVEDYEIPDSDVVIQKGTPVLVSILALHHDPNYFPEPERFDPERFSEERKREIPHFSYLPFGEGLRTCIGERFGLLSAKMGLAHIVSRLQLERCGGSNAPIEFTAKCFLLAPIGDVPIKFTRLGTE